MPKADGKKYFKLGRRLCIAGSIFPIVVGLYHYLQVACYEIGCLSSTTANDLAYLSQPYLKALSWVAYTNLIMTGITSFVLAVFVLPEKSKIAWLLILAATLWVGVNDAYAVLRLYLGPEKQFPVAIFPLTLGTLGCILCYSYVFANKRP